MERSTVINLYAGPGAGKSTTAARLFSEMKINQFDCELVTEYAKDLVYAERTKEFGNQLYIVAKQYHRLWKLNGKVQYIITDSPVLLNYAYHKQPTPQFAFILKQMYDEFDNWNYWIKRTKPFSPKGRLQKDVKEAIEIDQKIFGILPTFGVELETIESHQIDTIMDRLNDTKVS